MKLEDYLHQLSTPQQIILTGLCLWAIAILIAITSVDKFYKKVML